VWQNPSSCVINAMYTICYYISHCSPDESCGRLVRRQEESCTLSSTRSPDAVSSGPVCANIFSSGRVLVEPRSPSQEIANPGEALAAFVALGKQFYQTSFPFGLASSSVGSALLGPAPCPAPVTSGCMCAHGDTTASPSRSDDCEPTPGGALVAHVALCDHLITRSHT